MEIEGANRQEVPYFGYVELDITFSKEFVGGEVEVPTLVLVVPNMRANAQEQILLGTNTLDVLFSDVASHLHESGLPIQYGYRAVLKALGLRHRQGQNGKLGFVKLAGKNLTVPGGHTVALEGSVHVGSSLVEKWAVVENPTSPYLPGGLLVGNCLVTLPAKRLGTLAVMVKNETEHDVIIPPKTVIAELSAVQQVMPHKSDSDPTDPAKDKTNPSPDLQFDFGDSPLSVDWKSNTNIEINACNVFAHHDLDFGHASQVKHHIRLQDQTPFKQRAQPIHPQDVDVDAGTICKSESPFASPIVVVRKRDNSVRLCIDYRKLNSQTIKDAYALPNLEEAFSALTGSKWLSVLDLKSSYYQI